MNQFGEATANVNLNIESEPEAQGEPPVFVEKPTIKWEEGEGRVLMIALVKADPKPSAVWSKEMTTISSGGRYTISVTDDRPDVYRICLELRVSIARSQQPNVLFMHSKTQYLLKPSVFHAL